MEGLILLVMALLFALKTKQEESVIRRATVVPAQKLKPKLNDNFYEDKDAFMKLYNACMATMRR